MRPSLFSNTGVLNFDILPITMSSSRDAFGFRRQGGPVRSAGATVVVAQPGQEVRIVVPDSRGRLRGFGDSSPSGSGDNSPSGSGDSSPSGSGDSSPSGSGDSSPSGSGDSSPSGSGDSSPSGSGDILVSRDAFGFRSYRRGFSPSATTIVARPGQEIRVVVPDGRGRIMGLGDASPSGSGDSR